MLVVGCGCIEEHGDCSELKREFHVYKKGLKYFAEAFENYDFYPISKGRYSYNGILEDIEKYKSKNSAFYNGFKCDVVFYE
jgi:hypothetical protein